MMLLFSGEAFLILFLSQATIVGQTMLLESGGHCGEAFTDHAFYQLLILINTIFLFDCLLDTSA